jgi:branched-chain amino acid transport system ATP-binding protein
MMGMKPNHRVEQAWTIEKIYSYFPQLEKRDRQKGKHLSGGEQQMLTIGRTLMGNPELLLVDEATEGLAPALVDSVAQILRRINEEGCSILIVEHAVDVALSLSARAYIMSKGQIVFQGSAEEVLTKVEIRRKYLEV